MFQTVRHLLCVLAASWEYFAFQHLSSIFFTLGPMKSHSHSQVCRLVGSVLRAPEVQKDSECYLAHSVQYHTVYVKRCKNHCGASQNIQQAQGRQNPQGAWQSHFIFVTTITTAGCVKNSAKCKIFQWIRERN